MYFYKGNALVPVTVHVPETQAVASAAIGALLAGPPTGYATAIAKSVRLESVAIAGGVATAHLSGTLSHAGQGQLAFTLTQFPTITSLDGATRADFADLTTDAAIFVAAPRRDSTVSSPVHANGTADVFENLGVAAYNGAGQLIKNVAYLAAAGSIVSVEARHAAAIAELIGGADAKAAGAGHVDMKGLDGALSPAEVLPKAAPFIKTPVTANSLV